MPDIEFKDLNQSIGTELFADTESFLEDLTDDANIIGGFSTSVATITAPTTTVATTVIRPDDHNTIVTTTVYNPHPGGNSGINCTNFYTITLHNPPKTPPRHLNYRTIITGYF